MAALSYIFDASKGETPASVARKRAIAEQLMAGIGSPQNLGEGINALGHGIAAGIHGYRADRAEQEGMAAGKARWGEFADLLAGGTENVGTDQLLTAADDPWFSDAQREIAQTLVKDKITPPDPLDELRRRKLELEIEDAENPENDPEEFYGNLVPFERPDGTIGYGQPGKRGGFNEVNVGEGNMPLSSTKVVNTKTEQITYDRFGNELSRVPIENREAAAETKIGGIEGEQAAAAPANLEAGLHALELIEDARVDPNREMGTGWSAITNVAPGTPGYDYQQKVNEIKAGAFLTAIEKLQGMGALSNAEGQTATAAVTRINSATSEEEFLEALAAYEKLVRRGFRKALALTKKYGTGIEGVTPTEEPAPSGGDAGSSYKSKYGLD